MNKNEASKVIKDIRVEMRVRNNLILSIMSERGIETVAELSRLSKIRQTALGKLINMKESPLTSKNQWRKEVSALAEFFRCLPEDIFSETHTDNVLETNRTQVEVSFAEMQYLISEVNSDKFLPENVLLEKERKEQILAVLETLPPREKEIIMLHYGLDGEEAKSFVEIAKLQNVTPPRIREIEQRAFRKLRHSSLPSRQGVLKAYLEN